MANFTGNRRKLPRYFINERGCHICISHAIGKNGYPQYFHAGKRQTLHRALFEIKHGALPKGQVVRHKCDDRRCINLDHLEAGTFAQNTADMLERGRQNPSRGDLSGNAKLSANQILEIRQSNDRQIDIAAKYGVHRAYVSKIKAGKVWKHLCA